MRTTIRRRHFIWIGALVFLLVLVCQFSFLLARNRAERVDTLALYESIKIGMSEEELDAVLQIPAADFSFRSGHEPILLRADGDTTNSPIRTYHFKGEYIIEVSYERDSHRVTGKAILRIQRFSYPSGVRRGVAVHSLHPVFSRLAGLGRIDLAWMSSRR